MKVLKFYSYTCPPCLTLEKELQNMDVSNIEITNINTKESKEMSLKYNVRTIPTVIEVDEQGTELRRFGGIEFIKYLKNENRINIK